MALGGPSVDAPVRTGASAPDDAAVVIGVEDYAFLPDVPYATRDAQVMHDLFVYTLGVPPDRVRLLTDAPTRERVLRALEQGAEQVGSGGRLWVYFAGHGAASPSTGERILLGVDTLGEVDSVEARAIRVGEVADLAGAAGREAVLIVDACYSGKGRSGASLVEGARFAVSTWVDEPAPDFVEWSAAGADEWSMPLESEEHGAFTWAVAGALRGWADGQIDGTRDGTVTLSEARLFVEEALRLRGVDTQRPQLSAPDESVPLVTARADKLEPRPELVESVVQKPSARAPVQPSSGSTPPVPGDDPFGGAALLENMNQLQAQQRRPASSPAFVGPIASQIGPCLHGSRGRLGRGIVTSASQRAWSCDSGRVFVEMISVPGLDLEAQMVNLLGANKPPCSKKGDRCLERFNGPGPEIDPFDPSSYQRGSFDVAGQPVPWIAARYVHRTLDDDKGRSYTIYPTYTVLALDPVSQEPVGCHDAPKEKHRDRCIEAIETFLAARVELY